MDPPTTTTTTLMNETPSFNLAEIWPMQLNGGVSELGVGLDIRRGPSPFGPSLGLFNETGLSDGGVAMKRRESVGDDGEESPAKGVCNAMSDSDSKRLKSSGSGDENQNHKADPEVNSGKGSEQKSKGAPEPPKDYIHVRARRGQATDSHSLAERARREKISERMRILQDLVPGCNKVIGKALVLDEIINYIQSLQRQVEFLSMKLEAVNTRVSPGMEGFPVKDFSQQQFDASGVGYCSQPPREYGRSSSPDWLHMQLGGGFERQT